MQTFRTLRLTTKARGFRQVRRTRDGRGWGAGLLLLAAMLWPAAALAQPAVAAPRVVVLPPTFEASMGQPKVLVRLSRNGQPVAGPSQLAGLGLDDMLGSDGGREDTFAAYLDTGASAIVVSAETAARFGITREPGAVYHEAGLHGQTPMHVSGPFDVAVGDAPQALRPTLRGARLQINAKPLTGIMAMMGEINVVGMPVIERYVVELDPLSEEPAGDAAMLGELTKDLGLDVDLSALAQLDRLLGGGTKVTLHPPAYVAPTQAFDYAIPLKLADFNRYHNPADKGAKPALARNPMLRVRTQTDAGAFEGDWLLDTGAAACIISTAHAAALGLVDADGNPLKPQVFTLPLGGIGGDVSSPPGFVVDVLRLTADDGTILEYRDVHLLVHDIGTTLDDGTEVILDGVFGMNLLLPGAQGLSTGFPTNFGPPPFRRIWIDTQRQRLVLKLMEDAE